MLSVGVCPIFGHPAQTCARCLRYRLNRGRAITIRPTEFSARLSSVVPHIGKATSKIVKPQRVKETAYMFSPNFLKTQIKAHQAVIFQKIHMLSQDGRKPYCVRKQYAKTKYFYLLLSSVSKFEYYRNEMKQKASFLLYSLNLNLFK